MIFEVLKKRSSWILFDHQISETQKYILKCLTSTILMEYSQENTITYWFYYLETTTIFLKCDFFLLCVFYFSDFNLKKYMLFMYQNGDRVNFHHMMIQIVDYSWGTSAWKIHMAKSHLLKFAFQHVYSHASLTESTVWL